MMSMNRALFVIAGICMLCIHSAMAQEPVVSGTVRDETTGRPIRNVSVFFDRTLNGMSTDSAGNFTLYPQTTARLPLLLSIVGYASKTITDYTPGRKLTIELKPISYNLDAVTVMANDGMSREEKLKIFKREFLGSTSNGKSCEIVNVDDLHFTYSSKTHILKAFCDKPLIIRNKALGYTLNFLVSNFTYTAEQTSFYGSQFFREDANPPNPDKIKKSRKTAYLGSQMHFIRALWNNQLAENGFEAVRYILEAASSANRDITASRDAQYVARDLHRVSYDSLVQTIGNQKYLRFNGNIKVTYRSQISIMSGNGKAVLIDKNGYQDPVGVVWSGNIGIQRAGDLLPLEFNDVVPDSKKEIRNSAIAAVTASVLLDTLYSRMPQEKLYIHLDKAYYSSGDTLRMKAYLLDAAEGKGSEKSGIVYVELANDSNKVFYRRMLPVGYGLGTGNIILDKKNIPEGSYTLRAYTNLMRNFGEEAAFKRDLYVSSGTSQHWLVNSKTTLSRQAGKDNLQLAMQFNQLNMESLKRQDLEIRIMDGAKVLQRDKVQTDIDGKLDVNFNLPENLPAGNISMVAADPKDAKHNVTIPIQVGRPENIDLQFMPEGGNLVTGILSRVGFKAIGEDGNGTEVSGKVYNSSNEEVASFISSYKGIGSFEIKPVGVTPYTAKITLNGSTKSYPLPVVKNTGSVLRLNNLADSDSLISTVTVSTNLAKASLPYHLIGQSGGKVLYDEEIPVNGNTYLKKGIAKDLFPTGVVRFTLMDPDRQPLNERIVFIDHHDNLEITLNPAQASYKTRDSVSVAIEVKDSEGRPVAGSFSLAVTDDSQVRADSLNSNILTSLLLTSGLKGTIEKPGHYLQANEQAAADLDNLLLTQGWIGYDWKEVINPPAIPLYQAEKELVIKGKVTNVSRSSAATAVVLMSPRPSFVKTGVAEKDGSFIFSGFPVSDSLSFFVQARNPKVKSLEIEPVEFKPAVFKQESRRSIPWYVNSDTILLRQATRTVQQQKLTTDKVNLLQEVTITKKKAVEDSKNLNGAGEADQILEQKDFADTPKKNLLDLMKEKITGFNTGRWPSSNVIAAGIQVKGTGVSPAGSEVFTPGTSSSAGSGNQDKSSKGTVSMAFAPVMSYKILDKEMHLVIDGTDMETFYRPTAGLPATTADPQLIMQKNIDPTGDYILERNTASITDRQYYFKQILEGINAEDVKAIEVMSNPQFNARYKTKYAGNILSSLSMIGADFSYVEVTTYSGNGAFLVKTPGVATYRPVPFVNNAAFYKPKYTSKPNALADMRSTIHWEPDIVTDNSGKALVSFYSADRPGTYSIIIEGSNMKGAVGRKAGSITIK